MATIQEAYQAACNAGFIKRNEFSEEAFGNMLQNDNNRRAYYDHVTKIDPTFYSKDYDTFCENVLSALGQSAAKNSTNQPSNAAPAPSQVQPTFQPAQGQPTFWQSIGAHDPYPQKTAEGVAQFEKEQQLQRESAATMPLSQQDKDRQAEIQRLQTEGIWGKPNGITMDIDKQTGLPTINQTKGDGMHLSIGATPSNQDEIDRLKAEQPAYITREIKTPQDLYTSVSEAWAANTPDGQKAKAELDKTAQDTYNNLLADMNRQIADLQQQVNNGTVTQQQAQQEAQRIADNTNAVYENEMQLAQDYFFRQMTDANADYLSQQARLLGQKATNQTISDINARIAPHIRQLETERQQAMQRASQSVQAQGGMYGAIGASMSANTAYKPEKDQELALYHQSQQFLADAAKISDAAQKGQGFWKGLGNSLGDIDTWDFGISQLTRSANLKDIVEKYEKGEQLTDAEKGLMDSAVAYMSACAYNSDKLSRLYKAGQTTGESIPFMLQFAAMPIDAIKNKVAKGILGYGIEKFGGKAAQVTGKAAAKYGAKTAFKEAGTALLSNLAAAGVQTAAFGVPKIAEGAISRMTGDIQPDLDEQGNITYGGRQNQQGTAEAIWNSTVDMYAENLSEMILTSLDPLKAYAGTTKLFQGLKSSQIAQVIGKLNEGVIGKVRDRAQFRNYLEEVSEEYVGNLIRWGLSTDVNNAEDAGFSADQQIDTWLGLAPTSIAFVGAGAINSAVSGGIDRFQSSRAAKRLREIMADGDKRRYLESLLKSRNSDDFSKNAHEVIKSVLRDKELNEDTKRLIMDGIYSTYQSQLAQEAEQARKQAEAERQAQPEQPETANVSDSAQPQTQAQVQVNTEGEEHYQDADGNEVTFYRNADGSVTLRDKNGNAAVDEQGNAVTLTQTEFDQYARDTNLRRVDRELTPEQWAERENQLRQQYEAEVQLNTHNDGNVYEVVLASDVDKRGYIVGDGKVEIDDTTDPAVPRISNDDVVTVRYEDGTIEQLSARDLNLATTPTPAADVIQEITDERVATAQVAEQVAQAFRAGQEVTMDDGNGNTYTSHVVSVSADGVEVEIENAQGEPDTTIIPNEIALTALHPVEQKQPEQQVEQQQEPFVFVKTDAFGNSIEPVTNADIQPQQQSVTPQPQPNVPNIDTMLADELGASVVEYLGDKASAIAYLEAERDKADDDVKRLAKQKITRYTDIADFKRQNDELQAAKKAAADRYNKLQNAIATANNYKTKVEQAAEAERKAREEERRATRRQTQTAQLANAAPAERWKAAPKVEGNAVTRTLSDGTVIKGHYVLVEAGAATPSHDPFNGWNTSSGFPITEDGENINDRDYKNDKDAQQITTQIAQTYDGQAVAQVPVVSSEGIVYDGNGRTIAGNIAAANNTDGAYIQALADNAGNFGFASEQVEGMQHPRVYMQTDEDLPYNTTTFAKFNAQEKKSQGSTNRAVSSSKKLTEAARDGMLRILDDYGTLDAFFASENGAKDIVRSLFDNGIITQQEVAGLTESTDKGFVLSPAGKDYVTDLLIGGLFDEQTIRMLGNDKGLKQSILRAMPSIVENRRLGDYALTDNINNAIRLLYEARQAGMAYPLYVKQGNAFDGYVSDRFSPFEMLLAEEMSSGVETFRQVLNLYNNSARDEANGQTGLFEPRTFDDIKKEILQHYGKSTDQSAATAAESTQSRPANTQTEPPVSSTPTGDGQGIASTEQANSATEESSRPNEQAWRSKANNRQKKSEKTPTGEQTEYNGSKEQSQSQQSDNKIFTDDAYEAARRRMHERLKRLNAGLDPEMLSDGLIMAGYHVEKGARKFAEFAREMIREFGDKIRPYLKSFYNGLRDLPEAVELSKEMDDYGTVAQFDVNSISIERAKETKKTSDILPSAGESVTLQPKKVDIEGLFGALNTKGEAKLSDHIEQESLSSANAEDTQPIGNVTQSKHTKTGEDIWIVKPSERVSDDEFKLLKARAKANNGYYSSFAKNRGFIFKSKEDANNFNNISDEEITTDQTSADTETTVRTAETVVGETATITRDRRDSNRAEGEPGTESIEGGVREPRNVELTSEQANKQVTTRQQAIAKIDNANDKITDQLAVLGFYEADTSDPTKFHESYGYIKTAEAKAVKDIDRLAKQLADDLGIKVSNRKTIAKANIAPAGVDISFRLPLENGKELYLSVDLEPNFNNYYRADGDANSLVADHMFWRIEDPQANGTSRYLTPNQNYGLFERGQVTTTYADLLRDIRRTGRNYLPTIPAGTTKQEIAKQVAEKTTRKKKDTTRIADTQSMLDLFGDVAETMNEGAQQEHDEPERKFVNAVSRHLLGALVSEDMQTPFRSILDLRKLAKESGIEVDDNGKTDILLQELVEDGLVRAARQLVASGKYGDAKSKATYDAIVHLYEIQPTIAQRSSNRIAMQQYSTPLPMAFVADMFAYEPNMRSILEPTAGNGMLVFAVPAEKVHANELDETRLANLHLQEFQEVTSQDATEPFGGGKRYDAIIANPPFGSREEREYDGKMIAGLDPQITLNALASMKDSGKAAIIIGGNMEYADNGSVKDKKAFWSYLYDHYNVKGVVDMDGQLYRKQGTTYPTRMILIDGRRSEAEREQTTVYPPIQQKAIEKVDTFDDLYNTIAEITNSNKKTNGTEILRTSGGSPIVSDGNNTSGNAVRIGHSGEHRTNDVDGRENGGVRGNGRRNSNGSHQGNDERGMAGVVPDGNRFPVRPTNAGLSQSQEPLRGLNTTPDDGSTARPKRTTTDGERGGKNNVERSERVLNGGIQTLGTASDGGGLKSQQKRNLTEEKLPYRSHNTAFSLQSVAPAAMVEAMDNTLSQIEKSVGKSIDQFVTDELGYDTIQDAHNALAAEQMDSVAMAIYQMKQGQSLIIGDQTGVGKGRQMAALIRWAVRQGKKPIFVTQKADLFSDIYRDLVDIGSGDLRPFILNSDGAMVDANGGIVHKPLPANVQVRVFKNEKLLKDFDYVVLTYSQVNTGDAISQEQMMNGKKVRKSKAIKNNKPTPKATFLRNISKDNYLFLDESHTAAGDSNVGAFFQSIIGTKIDSGVRAVTFASATFAKRPDTMPMYALRTAMAEANIEREELIDIIEKGGVTLQEIMSRALTESGQMVRRERDMSDVRTDWKTIDDPTIVKQAREQYDRTIVAFNAIIDFQDKFITPLVKEQDRELAEVMSTANLKKGTKKFGVDNTPFASKTFNYTKQLMLALKVDAIVDEVEREIKAGRHPVIALESTMESTIKDYTPGETIAEPSFSASLLKGLDNCMQYTIKDDQGVETHMTYTPNELGEEGETAYYKLQDFIRESTKDIFISPLDAIIERLHEKGYRVGELTGRNTYVERTDDGKIVVRRRTDKDKKRMQREFNSGALDVLILNKSASTGISLHASEKFSDQRQRSMIIAQPLSDINDYMQMIGRIDRTGQVHRGYYINLGLPVPAESRFLMMLSTKLKSLNANTTTSQDSESNEVDAPDLLNKYGSQVVIEYLRDNPTIYEKIGEPLKKNSKKGDDKIIHANELDEYTPSEDDALKITGRVALLNTKEQEEFYNDVVRRYNDLIRYLNDTGTNDLKITTLPLRAKTISRKVSSVGREPNGNNPFAGNAYVEQVEMDVLRKPMKANEVQKLIVQLNGTSDRAAGRNRVKDIMSIVERETEDKMTLENERYENAKQKAALTLEEYARKINANEKMSSEQKATTIEQKQQETEQKLADKNRDNILSIQHKAAYLNRMLDMFTVGETYLVPDDLGSAMFSSSTHSIFCGYKVKDNKISASTSFAVFATLDGRRKVEIKLSDISILNRINDHTNQNWDAAQQTTLDNWDKQIPTQTRKEGYIMTGNILQAVADTQDEYGNYTGQLISYTDIDGNIHDGILMPDKWKTSQLRGGVPISARLEQMKQGTVVSTDGKVTIRRGWGAPDVYFLIVPKSKSEGGKYFLNPDILRLVEGNNFYTVRGHMQAEVPAQNIEAVLGILSDMGVKAQDSTIEAQYDELDYDTDNLTDAQQFDTDVLLGALDEAGISVERVSEEDAERELNSRQILEKSQKSTTFVPTSKVPKSELAVAHKALFAKVQDQSEAGIVYGVFSANYYHIFNGNQHQYAVRIEGNEDIISDIQKEIQYGTNKNANPLSQWVTDIQSGKGYDSRDNANATEQRGGDVDANALYGRQPTDSQRDSQESNGDSGITTPLRTTSGVIHGYAKDGKIYLTDKGFNPNTPIHEYTHLWVKAVRNNNAELYDNLRDLFSRENLPDMWNELDNDPQYRDLSDEAKLSEIIARFSGKRGAERMEQEAQKLIDDAKQEGKRAVADAVSFRERMRNLLRRFWNWVGEHLFRIKNFGSREEAADRVLYDLLNGTDLHQSPAEKDSKAEFSISPMPKRIEGEMVHEWAKRIAEWKRQQIDEQQVAEYAKLLDQNDSKKSKVFAYVVDKFTPIDNFQQWVQSQGGVYNHDTMDMHSDISLALGRIETFSRRYKNDYMQRIADSIAQIAKDNHIADPLLALGIKWQNFDNKKMNGKPLTVREIMGVYAQAKDTWEAEQQGLSDRGAQGFVKNLGASHTDIIEAIERIIPQKQLDEFWNAVYAANQFALDYQLNAGMIDPDTRNRYTRRYYVPQRGWRERDFDGRDNAYVKDNGNRLYGNPYNAALVKAHGRESLASDPFALIESIGLTSITQSEHNKSKQQLLHLLLANEMLGLKSGAWRVKQVWSKNVIDPRTGHVMRKPDGTPVQAEVTYAAPTQQEREHDASINAQIEQLRKELKDLTQPAARAKRETEIANLQDQLIYTGRATDTMLEHRTRDERLQHQIIVLHDGQQYVIELQDERLANAVNGNFGEAIKAYALFNKYNAPAIRYISGVLTQYNPRFAHRNFWRDAQAAFLNNLSEQGVAFTTRAMANIPMVQRTVWKYILADTYKGKEKYTGQFGDYLREYFEAGAQTGFSFMPELERMAKDFNKMVKGENAWDKVWGKGVKGTLSLMTEASELTVRFAEYVTARQMGRSVQEAAKLAKNISVNFNQSGLMSKEMSKFFTFFNATIQGNMRFLMPYGKNKPKFGERAFKFGAKFAGMAANFALLGLLSTFLQPDNPDDDTWFTEYDRMSNFILFGKVKIPIVHFFRMFYAAGVQAALAAQGRKTWKDAFYTSTDYALGELVPTSALQIQNLWDYDETTNTLELNPAKYAQAAAPSVISPLVDVAVNRDFKGSTVYRKKWDNDKKDITTSKRNTPQWAIDVSNTLHRWSGGNPDVPYKGGNTDGWIDIKPNAIEHIAQGYLSGVWESLGHTTGFIWDGAHDPDVYKHAANWPFLRDLFRDYNEEKAYNQQYYSVLQKLEKYEKRVNTLSKNEFNAEKQTNRFQTFKQVSKQLRRLPNPYNDEETTVTSEDVNKILQLDIELNRNLFTD